MLTAPQTISKVESHPFTKVAKLLFVDLAGSERVAKSRVRMMRLALKKLMSFRRKAPLCAKLRTSIGR